MADLPPTNPSKKPTDPDEPDGTGRHDCSATPAAFSPPDDIQAGTIISGKYKLLECIGEGGMGAVWMAQQTEPVKRTVAVKLIRSGMDSKAVLARFEAERQALSMMDHPNIARVFDMGTTPNGRPFFVMELVKGTPITEFCDQRKLTPRKRLELFVPVCLAIQHAHQKGIIHRDIKPSNVLVALHDDKPVPKVIDFGVAKATGIPLTEKTLHTGFEQVVGTPTYMSPEQATFNQLDIDTRSDVYSLGVLLYELLTGTTPIERERFRQAALLEMLRVVREEEPPRPSTRLSSTQTKASIAEKRSTEPLRLTKELRAELDWVVMKSLEKDRSRRYATAVNFAEDVQRYLTGEAVQAHPPSVSYRMRKFVWKNRGPVIAAWLVLAALGVGSVGTIIGLIRASQARDDESAQRVIAVEQRLKAEKARDRTRDVLDAMTTEVTGDSLSTQKTISKEQMRFLTEVLTYYKEFAGEIPEDEQSRKRTANAAYRVGIIEDLLGRKEESAAAFLMSRDLYLALAEDFPDLPYYRQDLAASHQRLGLSLVYLGKKVEAQAEYRKALALMERLVAEFPAVPAYRQKLALCHYYVGMELDDLVGKESEYRKALAIRERLAAEFPAIAEYRADLGSIQYGLGVLFASFGMSTEADAEHRKALVIYEKLASEFPAIVDYRMSQAMSHLALADLGKSKDPEADYRKALAIQEKLVTDFPAVPDHRTLLAISHFSLARLLVRLGKSKEGEAEYRKAFAIQEKLATDFPAVPDHRKFLAFSRENFGLQLAGHGNSLEAKAEYHKAAAIWKQLAADFPAVSDYRTRLALVHDSIGSLLAGLNEKKQAETEYREALMIREKLAADFPNVAEYRKGLGLSHWSMGFFLGTSSEAEAEYRKASAIYEKLVADFPAAAEHRTNLGSIHYSLGVVLAGNGTVKDAETEYRKAILTREKLVADFPSDPEFCSDLAASHYNLAFVLRTQSEWASADEQLRKAAALWERLTVEFPTKPQYKDMLVRVYYSLTCINSLASVRFSGKGQEYADRAMGHLQKAVQVGYYDVANISKNADLDPLRGRKDFQELLASLKGREVAPPPRAKP